MAFSLGASIDVKFLLEPSSAHLEQEKHKQKVITEQSEQEDSGSGSSQAQKPWHLPQLQDLICKVQASGSMSWASPGAQKQPSF